ncbi:Hypothetical predicted protein [Lecanosticta acicola]|uniref:Uncharacterized protein n=1 Tax=Lecanosticta acicola TaxID=111012 RepID=A0AAI9EF74_9PEZI|nr:Hypothetical predicted protein [Lecanosticta acicola]
MPPVQASARPFPGLKLVTTSCMDLNQQSRDEYFCDPSYEQFEPLNRRAPPRRARPVCRASPVSPNLWENEFAHSLKPDWQPMEASVHLAPEPLFATRRRSTARGTYQRSTSSRQNRRPARLQDPNSEAAIDAQESDMDQTFLYPQRSPFEDHSSCIRTPNQLQRVPRAVSQPNTPGFWRQDQPDASEGATLLLPRSPTYPPAGRRRPHSTSNIADATFMDEEEFHLFVQATAGLGQEQVYRNSSCSSESSLGDSSQHSGRQRMQRSEAVQVISPIQETPTTMYALQQLAQLPQGSQLCQQQEVEDRARFGRINANMDEIELWLSGASPGESNSMDDELPDYAESQAQAQLAQRAEAARRAQELQRRWQQSR